MAVIGQIRKRTGLLLIVIVGGLALFILQEGIQNFFSNTNTNEVGEIAGETIDREELEAVKLNQTRYMSGPRPQALSDQQKAAVINAAWEKMLFYKGYAKQFEDLGIMVTQEGENNEADDLYRGNTLTQYFKNFQPYLNEKGEVDRARIESFIQAMNNPQQLPREDQGWVYWWPILKQEEQDKRLYEKYTSLFTKSVYVNKYEAKMNYMASKTKASFNYLFIPYTDIVDSTVSYDESQLEEYYNDHFEEYKVADTRELEMVVFPIVPSPEDTARVMDEVATVLKELPGVSEKEDTMFVYKNSSDIEDPSYKKYESLPQIIKDDSASIAAGKIYGPDFGDAKVSVYKVTDLSKDTIYTADVSLIAIPKMDQQGQLLTGSALQNKIKEAQAVLDSALSGVSFDSLANKHSMDPSNFDQQTGQLKGGYVGEITNKSMKYFKEVNDAIFKAKSEGVQPEMVEVQTALFILKINKVSELTSIDDIYRVVTIDKDLYASKKTIRDLKTQANRFIQGANGSTEKFVELVNEDPNATLERKVTLNLDQINRGNFTISPKVGKSINLATWAFEEAEAGGAPKFFEVEGNYVVVAVSNATKKGQKNLEAVREKVEKDLLDQLKYEMFEERISTIQGPLKDIVDEYNKQYNGHAKRERIQDHILSNNSLLTTAEPNVIGAVFGIGEGNRSKPIQGNAGLYIVETIKEDGFEEPASYIAEAKRKQRGDSFGQERLLNLAIKDWANIQDNRLKNGAL